MLLRKHAIIFNQEEGNNFSIFFVNSIRLITTLLFFGSSIILNGGINSIEDALILSKKHDGVMVGRLVQSNPFCLSEVDKSFYNFKTEKKVYDKIIVEYFKYIKNKLNKESIYRLLSPLLNIFFGVPNSKKMRHEINEYMKKNDLNKLESLFLNFIQSQKI